MTYPVKIDSTQPSNTVEIRWSANNVCNFDCHYCFPEAHAKTHRTPTDLKLIINNFNHLFDEYRKIGRTNIKFIITGGEPTLWTEFGDFLEHIKTPKIYISVVSNASRTLRWWYRYGKHIDNAILSFHINQANIDHHIAVADELFEQGKKVTVLILMDTYKWNECVESIDYMKVHSKHKWFIEAKPIIGASYTKEQREFLQKELKQTPPVLWFIKNYHLFTDIRSTRSIAQLDDGTKLKARSSTYITHGYNNFIGWKCNIGIESIYVHWDGSIKGSCGQQPFDHANIFSADFVNTFKPTFSPSICQISKCTCLPETHISKSLPLS